MIWRCLSWWTKIVPALDTPALMRTLAARCCGHDLARYWILGQLNNCSVHVGRECI